MKAADLSSADEFERQWLQLFARAAVPVSVQQHPAWLGPLLDNLAADNSAVFVAAGRAGDSDDLCSLVVLERQSISRGFVLPVAATWDCGFLFSGMPLLAAQDVPGALHELLVAAGKHAGAVLFKKIPLSGALNAALDDLAAEGKVQFKYFDVHERAALVATEKYEQWYGRSFSSKRKKEYRRLRNRLGELGVVREEAWQPGQSLQPWIAGFLELEAAGWKGRRKTAIASNNRQAVFFSNALPGLAAAGHLLFWRIMLDDQPVAMLFAFVAGDQVLLGKIAYNEEFSHYSPGVMVILAASKDLLNSGVAACVDSAADPKHPMIDNIWRDRLAVGDLLISVPGTSKSAFRMRVIQEQIRRALRAMAKRIYHLLRRG